MKNFQFSIFNFQLPIVIGLVLGLLVLLVAAKVAYADGVTDNALNFLRSKQDVSGRVTTGFSAPSQWSAIAFAVSGVDVSTVKNSDTSLLDFLLSDIPASPSAATDWESKILAIVAIGDNPTNFGGVNFVQQLESFYTDNQLGDVCLLNDDIYGLLALIASGDAATTQIKTDTLAFLISKQDVADGGFGFSAPGCSWYETSADMTGAAVQAMIGAKEHGITHPDLDNAIDRAKTYLLSNQHNDGGFGYYGISDPDSTNQVFQALNVLGMQNSNETLAARNYLLALQSATDGGFTAYDWGTGTFLSNATTTAQSIIALSGKGFIVKIFDPASVASVSATPTITPTFTPTVTPTPTSAPTATPTPTPLNNSSSSTPTPTPFPVQVATNTLDAIVNGPIYPASEEEEGIEELFPTPTSEVLGASDETSNSKGFVIASIFAGLGLLFVFIYFAKPFIIRKLF